MQPELRVVGTDTHGGAHASTPERPDLSQLRTQAKDLLRAFRRGDAEAASRVRQALPAARGKDDAALAALEFRLHDAQSCVAREYGFASWAELRAFVDAQTALRTGLEEVLATWVPLAYGRGTLAPKPAVAARLLEHRPDLIHAPLVACAVGDSVRVRAAMNVTPHGSPGLSGLSGPRPSSR